MNLGLPSSRFQVSTTVVHVVGSLGPKCPKFSFIIGDMFL
jgi:hypothetical protein